MSKSVKKREGKEVIGSTETVIYLLDCSGSMTGGKIDTLRTAMTSMLEQRMLNSPMDSIGAVLFGVMDETEKTSDLDKELGELLLEESELPEWKMSEQIVVAFAPKKLTTSDITRLRRNVRAELDTPMFSALHVAIRLLDSMSEGLARIILFSDGEPSQEDQSTSSKSIKSLIFELVKNASSQLGIIVDTVGIGQGGYDKTFMKDLASAGSGTFYDASKTNDLKELIDKMANERRVLLGEGIRLLGDGS